MWEKLKCSFVFWVFLLVALSVFSELWLSKNHIDPFSNSIFGFLSVFSLAIWFSFLMGSVVAVFIEKKSRNNAMEEAMSGLMVPFGKTATITICNDVETLNGKIMGSPKVERCFAASKNACLYGERNSLLYLCSKKEN